MNIFQYLNNAKLWENPTFFIPLLAWLIFWKGHALYLAANKKQKLWFWIIMIANTLGILEILYLLIFSKSKEELIKMFKKCPIRKFINKRKVSTIETSFVKEDDSKEK